MTFQASLLHDQRRGVAEDPGAGAGLLDPVEGEALVPRVPIEREGVLAELVFRGAVVPAPERVLAVQLQLQEALVQLPVGIVFSAVLHPLAQLDGEFRRDGDGAFQLGILVTHHDARFLGPRGHVGIQRVDDLDQLGLLGRALLGGRLHHLVGEAVQAPLPEQEDRGDGQQQG